MGVSSYSLISHVALPGPKPWPYVGNLLDAFKYGGLHNTFLEYDKKYGKVYKMYLGRDPIIAVTDLEMLKRILVKDFDKFRNRPEFIAGNPPLNKGLFGARDDAWKRARSILNPTFSASKLKEIVPIIEEAVEVLVSKMKTFAHEGRERCCLKGVYATKGYCCFRLIPLCSIKLFFCASNRTQHISMEL